MGLRARPTARTLNEVYLHIVFSLLDDHGVAYDALHHWR